MQNPKSKQNKREERTLKTTSRDKGQKIKIKTSSINENTYVDVSIPEIADSVVSQFEAQRPP